MKKRILAIATMAALMLSAMSMGQAQTVPITLEQGYNWISYPRSEPMTIQEALSGFTPANGDMILSQSDGNATYRNGRWVGQLSTFIPGKGYKYVSADGTTKTFVFGGTANDPSALPEAAMDGEFTVAANGTKVRFSPGNLQCRVNPSQETQAVVGMGTSTTGYMPYYTLYKYSLCQMLYKAEELQAVGLTAGTITSIAFQSESTLHYLRNGIEVWITNTTLTSAPSTSVSTSGMQKVFEGSLVQQTGWTEIVFSSSYLWNGTSNLLVTVVMNHGSWDSATQWQCGDAGFTCSNYKYNDNNAYDPSSTTYSMTTTTSRPNTRFNGKGGATWRFAEQQWDIIGTNNVCASGSYKGWIDLFGWGTSGHPHGANCYQPWSTSTTESDYYAYGDASYNLFDQTGEADWGCNAISNGGDKPNQWRTLTKEEWVYIIYTRSTTSGKRYAKATVDGVNGLILLPDNWSTSYYTLNSTNSNGANFSSNVITVSQWNTLEQHGAVFLPAAGSRGGNELSYLGTSGQYWSSSYYNSSYAHYLVFGDQNLVPNHYYYRWGGRSVRLVCQSNPRVRTIGVSGVTTTTATVNAEVDCTGSTTVTERGVCWNTTGGPTVSDNYYYAGTGKGSYTAQLTGLEPKTTYHVRAYAKIGNVYRYGNELTFTTTSDCIAGGHEYVDLGLPSGLLWATCNVGADNPEDYGGYFAWGETQPKDYYNWSTYQHCNGSENTLTKYCNNSSYGYNGFVDNQTTLFPEDDAATANWGSGWRMPTKEEWQELLDNTTVTRTTQNGVNGRLFTATNGNSLFLPAAGWRDGSGLNGAGIDGTFWSSSLYTDGPYGAWGFFFHPGSCSVDIGLSRRHGHSVRPVCSSRQN